MGNVQAAPGRRPLTEYPGFADSLATAKQGLIAICQQALTAGETGLTIPYTALLVANPNRDIYDDYLISQIEIRNILGEVIHQPYTVENVVVKTGDIIFYNQSYAKVLFVYGLDIRPHIPLPASNIPTPPPTPARGMAAVAQKPAAAAAAIDELLPLDLDTIPEAASIPIGH
jgi:hypothetical protein